MSRPHGSMEDWESNKTSEFVLWSASMGGWFTRSSTYSSDLASARRMTWEEARATCQTHLTAQKEFGMIPVRLEDLEAVRGQ